MRGVFLDQGKLFSYLSPEARVPASHPLRNIRELVRDVLGELNRSLGRLYASEGRPSIPPEQLLSALLLQVFYGIRSERQLMEQLDYNLCSSWNRVGDFGLVSRLCLLRSNPSVRSAPSFRPDLHARYADARSGGQGWPAFGPPLQRREASLTAASTTA